MSGSAKRIRVLLGTIILASAAQAQWVDRKAHEKKTGLQLALFPDVPKPRSNAPIGIEATFSGLEPGKVVEGRLRIDLRERDGPLATWESPELAISSGEISFRFMLPAATMQDSHARANAHCTLLTKDKEPIELGTFPFPLPTEALRNVTIATAHPAFGSYPGMRALQRTLTLQHYDPEKAHGGSGVDTSIAYIPPGSLGVQAMEYCPYDLLILAGNGFSHTPGKQLEAISTWVKAGGSVLVIPSTSVKDVHLAFLNGLAGGAFTLNEQGLIGERDQAATPGHRRDRPGLGRIAVVFPPPGADTTEIADPGEEINWRKTVAHLYMFREMQARHLVKNGTWRVTKNPRPIAYKDGLGGYAPRNGHTGQVLGEHLLPKDLRLVPAWAIFLVLLVFVLVIGPLDYTVLGKFRKRKYTWILFPFMSILFTVFMIKMAEYFMGTHDHYKTLRVVDVDTDGRVLRQNRLTMYFTARHKQIAEKGEGGLISLVKQEGVSDFSHDYAGMSNVEGEAETYTGRLPGAYVFHHTVKQWTPTLLREMQFDGEGLRPPTFWKELTRIKGPEARCEQARKSFNGQVILLWNRQEIEDFEDFEDFESQRLLRPDAVDRKALLPYQVIAQLSTRDKAGWFAVASAVSPNGAGNFEDMGLLDWTDLEAYVITAIEERNGELILYRCLYQGDES
jgi:hypothetical protein